MNPNEKALREIYPEKIMDQTALTISEFASLLGKQLAQSAKIAQSLVDGGTWEQVYKLTDSGRTVKAFRKKSSTPSAT